MNKHGVLRSTDCAQIVPSALPPLPPADAPADADAPGELTGSGRHGSDGGATAGVGATAEGGLPP